MKNNIITFLFIFIIASCTQKFDHVGKFGSDIGSAKKNESPTLTAISTLNGCNEDTPLTISYTTLAAAANETDPEGDAISFRVESITTGTLKKNGTTVGEGITLLSSGESLVWTPAANANGLINAFTVKAYDGTSTSASAVQVTVAVTAVNDAPTLTTISTLTGATEDTAFNISYATLAAAANEADVDGDTISFRVEAVSSGTLTKNGVAVTGGTTLLSAGETLVWTPAADANGTLNAFTVKAYDGTATSASAVQVKVSVSAVNDAPTLTTISTLTGAIEDTAFNISYTTLAAAADEADVDGDAISFQIEAISSGTLTKNGIAVTNGSTLLSTGETLVWTPAANANGTLSAFTVKAYDGTTTSATAIQVNVETAAVNDAPTLTSISTLTGGVEDTALSISYATLAAAADEADVDGDTISFRVEAVSTGTLTKDGVAVTAGSTLLSSGETLVWTPAANANGTLNAFTVKAYDGTIASSTAIQVKVSVTAVNDAPTLTTISTLTGATENTAFNISYATLTAAANGADVDGDTLSFQVEAVSTGTLTKNGVSVTTGSTLLSTGETLVWTPASNASGTLNAFTVKAYDGITTSASAIQVKVVTASASNHAPTLTTISNLTGATEDTAFNISYATLAAAANGADVDGDTLSFQVEAVSTGTLTKNGTAVSAGSTLLSSGETLVWTPAANANGALNAFTVKAYDGTTTSATAIQVIIETAAVNDAPTISFILNTTTNEDTATSEIAFTISDDSTPTMSCSSANISVVSSSNGTLISGIIGSDIIIGGTYPNCTAVITPALNQNGSTNIILRVTDNSSDHLTADSNAFTVTVTPVNDAPTLTSISTLTGAIEDTAFSISYATLSAASNVVDVDGDTISFRVEAVSTGSLTKNGVAVSAGSTLLSTGETLVWTPASNANGTLDAFTVKAYDGTTTSSSAVQVKVTTSAVNDTPVASAQTIEVTADTTYTSDGATYPDLGGSDVEGSSLSCSVGTAATHGTASVNSNCSFTYTPTSGYTGADSFTFTVNDGELTSTAATVTINVSSAIVYRASKSSTGEQGTASSKISAGGGFRSMSSNGRYIVFYSDATNLVTDDTNDLTDVFLHDRTKGITERISVSSSGDQQTTGSANGQMTATVSSDGNLVAFESNASDLVSDDTNDKTDIFLRNRSAGTTIRISVDSQGNEANGNSRSPMISSDGRYIAYESSATNLVADDTNGVSDIFLYDRNDGSTIRISNGVSGVQANGASGGGLAISDDVSTGLHVAFVSSATNLVSTDTNGVADVFVYDHKSGNIELVSVDSSGTQSTAGSNGVSISNNGRYVVFSSAATNLVDNDTNGTTDIFLRDRTAATTTRISVDSSGNESSGGANAYGSISGDGTTVAFYSLASNLVAGDTNAKYDVFVKTIATGAVQRVTVDSNGVQSNNNTYAPCISNTGRYVSFYSDATNLVSGDTNASSDLFIYDRLH